ncbi:ABC transporter B family member 6 [Artemisia annua]|uniref:ABC transporter B family member 6 n=1 Tax=Artemisia annua TaxID=35608 RepID=A0A2U1K9F5_ARTAN|nr:ABC transporter B family member 6 [Artemisia annua]
MMIQRGLFGWSPPHIQPLTPVSEVSEPPESPSPYTDVGGNANDLQLDQGGDDEMDDENEEMEAPPAAVPFSKLFVCADKLDWCLMVVGSVAAAAHGTALVVYLHYFAKIVQLLAHGRDDPDVLFDKFKDVSVAVFGDVLFLTRL